MAILIGSSTQKKVFNKNLITIGSTADCDFVVDIGKEKLILQYSEEKRKYILANKYGNPNILFKGAVLNGAVLIESALKLTVANSSEFIVLKVAELPSQEASVQQAAAQIQQGVQNNEERPVASQIVYTQQDMKNIYGEDADISTKEKIEQQKAELEALRSPVIKQVGFAINDIKNRLSLNSKTSVFVHIAMFFSAIVTAFGVSNFITGLKIEETSNFINLPTNLKILGMFAVLMFGLGLILKQSVFLYFQNQKYPKSNNQSAQSFLLSASVVFYIAVYAINLIYYMNVNVMFAILISLFFVGLSVVLAASAGYFKCTGHFLAYELDKYEYREDFEAILNKYRLWIEKYINTLSKNKLENIKDRLFNLQLKSYGEIVLGIITAPFLAYGVSNTLAMCFPEAAGWIRISNFRFSPIFLVLATFLIIFAFFSFVNAFLNIRKVQASQVIKHDGFSDYFNHGVEILGIQAVRKLDSEKIRSLVIGCAIIFIEFTMNVSYFSTEIGGDLQGLLVSVIAALVPTAMLIAETYMLSQTKFDMSALSDLLAKKD